MARKKTDLELNFVKRLRKSVTAQAFADLPDLVRATIKKGISPVQGAGRFLKYSKSYVESIILGYGDAVEKDGKISPVDMTQTGDMLDSLKVVTSKVDGRDGAVRIEFDDRKAYFHNTSGAGRTRVIRRLLPDRAGEKFSRNIQQKIIATFNDLAKKAARK